MIKFSLPALSSRMEEYIELTEIMRKPAHALAFSISLEKNILRREMKT